MILAIDANNIAHRVFHTKTGTLTTKDGKPSGVVMGVLKSIKGYVEKFPETSKVIMCWDGGRSQWRKDLYPDYKAQRDYGSQDEEKKKMYDGLWMQMEELHKFLPSIGVDSIKIQYQEADDVIASIARCNQSDKHVMIVSSDKDMLQLVDDNVSMYSPYGDKITTPLNFFDETGVDRAAYIGYRALVGDTSDNIKGIPGIGDKTAKNLMDKYGHINNILNAQGADKKALLKSKRTAKIFDPEGLNTLGVNNKIMSFNFCEYDKIEPKVKRALEGNPEVCFKGTELKEFCMEWQFVSILSEYMAWSMLFSSLGED